MAYSVLRNREDAEDVAQEAFAKAYRSFSQLRDRDRFRAWLVRMTWRMALDRQRANRRRTAREDHADTWLPASAGSRSGESDLQVGLEARERAEHLWRAIDDLSEKLRIVIVLAGIQGHDIKEVAALLDLPEGTVKSRLFVARQQLKDALSWMAQDHSIPLRRFAARSRARVGAEHRAVAGVPGARARHELPPNPSCRRGVERCVGTGRAAS